MKSCKILNNLVENPDLPVLDGSMSGLGKEGVTDIRQNLLELKEQGRQY